MQLQRPGRPSLFFNAIHKIVAAILANRIFWPSDGALIGNSSFIMVVWVQIEKPLGVAQ
jgi:hypothetical protein